MDNAAIGGPTDGSTSAPLVEIELSIDEARLAKFFGELNADFVILIGPDGRMLSADPDTLRALGYSMEEFCALHVWDVCPIAPESWPERFQQVRRRPGSKLVEARTRSAGTLPALVHLHYARLGAQEYLVCSAVQARSGEPSGGAIPVTHSYESSQPAIFILTDGQVVDSNRAGPDLFGAPFKQIAAELESSIAKSVMLRERAQNEAITFVWHSRRRDHVSFTIEATLSCVSIGGRKHMLAVLMDLSARRKPERAMAHLVGCLLDAQDAERKRVAQELHNNAGQNISALAINLSMILARGGNLDSTTRESLEESISLADQCVRDVRALSYQLHPPLLGELGLVSALRVFAEGYTARTGVELDLHLPQPGRRLPADVEIALFRIVEEGLENVHRHADSGVASLILKFAPGGVELELTDQGKGLPPGTLEWDGAQGSSLAKGIAGMRARARRLGGNLSICSGRDGTTLYVSIPANVL